MMFSCLRDYYERLDESDVLRVLKEVERGKKDSFEIYNVERKQRSGMESPRSFSSEAEKSRVKIDFNE